MKRLLVDVARVAAYELVQAVRTRLFALVTLGYLAILGLVLHTFIVGLAYAESNLATTMHVGHTSRPGALVGELAKNGQLVSMLEDFLGSEHAARGLLAEPPLALAGSAMAMFLLPAVFLFTTPGSIASEVSTRSIRYLACRTDRLAIGIGKLVGQILLGAVAAALGIALTLAMGAIEMVEVPFFASLHTLVSHTLGALFFAMPYAALGLACSSLFSNAHAARAVAAVLTVASLIGYAYVSSEWITEAPPFLAELVLHAMPNDAFSAYWSSDALVRLSAFGRGVVLVAVLHAVAQARLDRRDL